MLRRVVRIGAIGSIVGLSAAVGVCSYTNHEFNAIGVVRFGRCASTVSESINLHENSNKTSFPSNRPLK